MDWALVSIRIVSTPITFEPPELPCSVLLFVSALFFESQEITIKEIIAKNNFLIVDSLEAVCEIDIERKFNFPATANN